MSPKRANYIRYQHDQLHASRPREPNWASSWARVSKRDTYAHFESSSSEDEICLKRVSDPSPPVTPVKKQNRGPPATPSTAASSSGVFDHLSSSDGETVIEHSLGLTTMKAKPTIIIDLDEDEESQVIEVLPSPTIVHTRALLVSPHSSGKLVCQVRGCQIISSTSARFTEHLFQAHPKAKQTEELRDLVHCAPSGKQAPPDLKSISGVGSFPNTFLRLLRCNPRSAKLPIQSQFAYDVKMAIDPKIGQALTLLCEQSSPEHQHSIDALLARIVMDAEEITLMSRRRLCRYLALLRDILLQLNGLREHRYSWGQLRNDLDRLITESVIESVVRDISPCQLVMLARPATQCAVKRCLIAVARFVVTYSHVQQSSRS